MNQKTLQVLSILTNSPQQYFKYEDLAKALCVGTRSIRNYVQVISDYLKLKEPGRTLISVSDKGIAFMGSAEEGRKIYLTISDNDFYLYRLSPNERVRMILLLLLLSDSYLKLSDFSERFNTSRATIVKDMEQVKRLLERHNLSFSPLINKGYLLVIPEAQQREMIEKTIADNSLSGLRHPSNYSYHVLVDESGVDEQKLADLIVNLEVKYDINVSDACFDELLLFMIITAARLKAGHAVVSCDVEELSESGRQISELAEEMLTELTRLEPHLALPVGFDNERFDSERRLLAKKLQSCRFYPSASGCNGADIQLHIVLSYFLVSVGQELSIPFYSDKPMIEMLEMHLDSMIKLHASGSRVENEYTRQIIEEYPEYYEAVKKHKRILENYSGYEYRDEDIVFVIMYLLVSADKYFTDDVIPRVIVCCHTGMGTANFLAKQLKASYNIEVAAVTSNHKLPELLKLCECDLIITTMPLAEMDKDWIKVSPMLTDRDVVELSNWFSSIKKEKGYRKIKLNLEHASRKCTGEGSIREIKGFGERNILLDRSCETPEEAIRLSAGPLLENGSIRPEYVDAILDFYHENGAYFVYCPHVALAHASPDDGVNAFGFTILRLNPQIPFHSQNFDPVQYVVCMSLTDKQSHTKEVLNIMTIFSIPENIEILNSLRTPGEVYQMILKKWEDTYES